MELNTRTVYSAYLQTCMLTKRPFVMKPFTTLNERFDIQAGVAPATNDYPGLGFMVIGNGGHRMVTGAGGKTKPEPIQHLATDAAPYDPLPWVLRLPSEDLTSTERANYALRKEETYDGRTYIAYYARRLDFSTVVPVMQYITVDENGDQTVTDFEPNNSNLFPTPQNLENTNVNVPTGTYVSASAKILIPVSAWEANELINVAQVKYADPDYAIISEVELVTGVNKTVSVSGPSGTFNFNEVIAAQVASHVAAFYPVRFSRNGFEISLDVGATEPLFRLVEATS